MGEASEHTTQVLLQRTRTGDARARAALVARIEPLLQRFAHGHVGQPVARREVLDLEPAARRDAPGQDLGAQMLMHALIDGAAEGQRDVLGIGWTDERQGMISSAGTVANCAGGVNTRLSI